MKENIIFVILLILSYFLGTLSPSSIIARSRGLDIKKEGSGNAGTTNALRVLGGRAALVTLVVDIGKGFLAVCIAGLFIRPELAAYCGFAAFVGHVFPVFLRFDGGKGVATAFGALLGIDWKLALLCLGIVILIVLVTRMVSMGSVVIGLAFPLLVWFLHPSFFWPGLAMALILLIRHSGNIGRLMRGEEDKISFRRVNKEEKDE